MTDRIRIQTPMLALAFLLLALIAPWQQVAAQPLAPAEWNADWPMSPAFVEAYDGLLPPSMPAYSLAAALDSKRRVIEGEMRVTYTNDTADSHDSIAFRLFPNAPYYGEGNLLVSNVTVDQRLTETTMTVEGTALIVPLAKALAPGSSVDIAMRFETLVPLDSQGGFGIFNYDGARQTWILANWYPILAMWVEGAGWHLHPPTQWGDPTFSRTSTYDVDLSLPLGMTIASSGSVASELDHGETTTHHVRTGPVREFAMVLDDGFTVSERSSGDVTVRLHTDQGTPPASADSLLDLALQTVIAFSDRYGPYPYEELDIVQTPLASALGVSWAGILFVDANGLHATLTGPDPLAEVMRFTLTHEIGHQWWGALVGVDSNAHAFMNESLTNILTVVAIADVSGQVAANDAFQRYIVGPYLALLRERGDRVVDTPIGDVEDSQTFSRLNYGKGALGFLAIRAQIGDTAFFHALREYAADFAFGIATPADLRSAFQAASGQDIFGLWSVWFDQAVTSESDVDALIERMSAPRAA
jgi:hypothetical protein